MYDVGMTMDFLERIAQEAEDHINEKMEMVYANRESVGLDPRVGPIFINEEAIAVCKQNDGTLQYYGGFEYVDKTFRQEIGDYVFYIGDDDRVREHINKYLEKKENGTE